MRSGHRIATTLALPALMILPLAAAASAQGPERTSDPTRLPFTGYVGRMIGSSEVGLSPEASQVIAQFFEFLNDECTAVATADSERLRREETWYMAVLRNVQEELWWAEDRWWSLVDRDQLQRAGQVRLEIADLEFTLAAIGLISEVVGECIDERRRQLEAMPAEGAEEGALEEPLEQTAPGEAVEEATEEEELGVYKEVYRTWTARCEGADGIEPPFAGLFTLLLPGDGSVQGVLRPGHNNVGLQFAYLEPSTLNSDGSFRLATPAGAANQVEVLAPAHPDPPATAGTIRMSGVKEGYGAWSCTGSWTGQ